MRDKYPLRPFELLHQMASIPILKSSFPPSLFHHFNDNPFPKSLRSYNCITSIDLSKEYGSYVFCLEADIEFQEIPSSIVRLHNLVFQGKSLDISVSLTPFDAFLTFSNICVNCFWDIYHAHMKLAGYSAYDRSAISIDRLHQGTKIIHEFCLDYLDFLKESILKNNLTPFEIFRSSGFGAILLLSDIPQVKTFIHEALDALLDVHDVPSNLQLIYYSLYCNLLDTSLRMYSTVKEYSDRNREVIEKLKQNIEAQYTE